MLTGPDLLHLTTVYQALIPRTRSNYSETHEVMASSQYMIRDGNVLNVWEVSA